MHSVQDASTRGWVLLFGSPDESTVLRIVNMKTREALKTVGGEHSTNGALLIVTDVQQAGDAFNVLDFGTAVGSHATSACADYAGKIPPCERSS